jgi:organic hydroperoxide reductase OsmC/OhrA
MLKVNKMSSPIHYYVAKVEQKSGGKGGAEGRIATLSNPENPNFVQLTVQSPVEFKGPAAPDGRSINWTPEDLFVSSVAVCFFSTFVAIAERSQLEYTKFEITAKGKLEKVEGIGDMITEITEVPIVTLKNPADHEKAIKILEKVEKNCLVGNSMKSKINVDFQIRS